MKENRKQKNKQKTGLTTKILLALVLGAVTGVALYYFMPDGQLRDDILINGVLHLIGQAFIRLMQMLVIPLVFFSLISGSMAMGDTERLGKIGLKTLALYLSTTAVAVGIALGLSNLIHPGRGMDMTLKGELPEFTEAPSAIDTVLNVIPKNPIQGLAEGNMLQVIFFALIIGVILAHMGRKAQTIARFCNEANDLMMIMTSAVMRLAPYGVFCLITKTFATLGFDAFGAMIKYMLSVLGGLGLQVLLTYSLLALLFIRVNPFSYLKRLVPVLSFAFSTASSGATIPVTIQTLEDMGISKKVSSFTIPLGATINMDGTAIMQGCAVVFVSEVYGIPLGIHEYLVVIATATLASIGTAGIPSVGLITLAMVFNSVGLPVEGIAMIMGIDRILDMARTAVNVTGDTVVTGICARQEGAFDLDRFYHRKPVMEETEI